MNDLPRDVETNSVLLLKESKSLFQANLSAASSLDLLNILRDEQNESHKLLTQSILEEIIRRGAYQRERLVDKAPVFRAAKSRPVARQTKELR